MLKKCVVLCSWVLIGGLFAEQAPRLQQALEIKPQVRDGRVARKIANMMPAYHVTQQLLNDTLSVRAWTNLVTMYDYNHAVFLQSDITRFEAMKTKIDDAMRAGDVSFVYDVHRTFLTRLDECVCFVTNLLETTTFDWSQKEDYLFNRKDAPWPEDRDARNELWRKRIKNEMLAQLLSRELDQEEDDEALRAGKKKKDRKKVTRTIRGRRIKRVNEKETLSPSTNHVSVAESEAKPEPTPKENLLNKYRHYLAWMLTELDDEKVLERYMLAVTMAYDPHSNYFAPTSKEDFDMDMNLSLCGVGAVLSQSMDDGALEIKEILKGGPMAREGSIKEGDKIVGVAQGSGPVEDVVWKPMRKSIKKIRGKKNSVVVLEVTDKNGSSRRRVRIVRDEIKLEDQAATGRVETVTLNGVSRKMGYVKLPGFYGTMDKRPGEKGYVSCSGDVANYVARFNTEGTDGMILDLRGNGGGSLKEAVLLTALFVRPNPGPCPVVQIRDVRSLYVLPTFRDQPTFAYRKPLIVLIDRHSASASEIVAGALQDTGRALVVGDTQSHGKGTVQTVMPMGNEQNGSIKITTARFYRINGSSTQVKGVASDICLPSPNDAREDVGEDKLPNALPWTRIEPARFQQIWNMKNLVDDLRTRSRARTDASTEWKHRLDVVKLCHTISAQKSTTLERASRKEQMKKERAVLEEADLKDLSDEDDESLSEAQKEEKDEALARKQDIVLTEAFNILSDMVDLTHGSLAPEPPPPRERMPAWLQALQGGQE